ncbi:MAG: acyl-CoA dehydrogenase family protein, partial [Pseudomonadales bacterium]
MDFDFSVKENEFRQEVREFLREKFTPDLREATRRQTGLFAEGELARQWQQILYEKGWIAPSWPKEYGGTGWTPTQRYLYDQECGSAGTPYLPAMGLRMCGTVIMHFGTQEQKEYFLPRILNGQHYWCQGYSEPSAGSDLAGLKTRATQDGDDYIINGTKIWTTHAHYANWIFLLARTGSSERPQDSISFFVTPLDAPGISITPIISMSGEHEVNQVFFDDVRIPGKYRIGAENEGWSIAKYLLKFERGGAAAAGRLGSQIRNIRSIAELEVGENGRPLWED